MWCFGGKKEYPVELHLYDLSGGTINMISKPLMGTHLEAIWHSGLVVYNQVTLYNITQILRNSTSQTE